MSNRPICGTDTPDPWIVQAHGKFYLTFTLGNRVEIWQSAHLEDFRDCQKSNIWVRSPCCLISTSSGLILLNVPDMSSCDPDSMADMHRCTATTTRLTLVR